MAADGHLHEEAAVELLVLPVTSVLEPPEAAEKWERGTHANLNALHLPGALAKLTRCY